MIHWLQIETSADTCIAFGNRDHRSSSRDNNLFQRIALVSTSINFIPRCLGW